MEPEEEVDLFSRCLDGVRKMLAGMRMTIQQAGRCVQYRKKEEYMEDKCSPIDE